MEKNLAYQLDIFLHGKKQEKKTAHAKILHRSPSFTCIARLKPKKQIRQDFILGHELPDWINEFSKYLTKDVFISQNQFKSAKRRITNIENLGALYADVDFYKIPIYENVTLSKVISDIYYLLEKQEQPQPSYIIDSGNGLHVVWLLENGYDLGQLGKWQALQNYLIDILKEIGSDRKASDASRILRLAGTRNTTSQSIVTVLEVSKNVYTFENFKLPPQPPQPAHRNQRTARQATDWRSKLLWGNRLKDLLSYPKIFKDGLVKEGFRNSYCVLFYNALGQLGASRYWQREKLEVQKYVNDYPTHEIHASLKTLDKRQKEGNGYYKFRNSTIREWLGLSKEECIQHGLHSFAGNQWLSGEENTTYQRDKRRSQGMLEREEYLNQATKHELREAINNLQKQGLNSKEIAKRVNISHQRVRQLWTQKPIV